MKTTPTSSTTWASARSGPETALVAADFTQHASPVHLLHESGTFTTAWAHGTLDAVGAALAGGSNVISLMAAGSPPAVDYCAAESSAMVPSSP